ncbi:DUF3368 domain-containing protein [Leptothoe sp. PORK10 BA2]|uniref:DUF3368 domain-containing protein n=1 Tax=Leptothoe sp. PORK10 BA2 TaxID=3110254 RepID=UPI003FA35227
MPARSLAKAIWASFYPNRSAKIASLYKLKYTGTLGVLIKAKQQKLIPTIQPILDSLQKQGMWLSQSIITEALRLAGEID